MGCNFEPVGVAIWAAIAAPLWIPVAMYRLSLRTARRIRRGTGYLFLATAIFAMANSGDRSHYQWGSMFLNGACGMLWVGTIFGTQCAAARQPDRRRTSGEAPRADG